MQLNGQLGAISTQETFFYPDTPLTTLPDRVCLAMAKNGCPGVQLLLKADAPVLHASLESDALEGECFRMHAIPVEKNTGNGEDQGGAMVLEQRLTQKPAYATRLAPFCVFDCLQPAENGEIQTQGGLAALYMCIRLKAGSGAGRYEAVLHLGEARISVAVHVYDVDIPQDAFPVTNWFSMDAICRFHQVEKGTPAFLSMLQKYIRAMRRMHQTMFYLELDDACVVSRKPYAFDFEYLTPIIELFFAEGMQTMELGTLLSRGFLPDGKPDMLTDCFKCAMATSLPIETPEGYGVTVQYVQALAEYLIGHGWQDRVVFHIHDEPDIHCPDEPTLHARRRQYLLAASILRKYLPGVRVIEAVASPAFFGGVDLWVPGTPGYEKHKADFDRLIGLGEAVWAYVCCGPEGHWLNRFLDFALLKGRLLFWGCAKNRLGGFLHWGFNQFPEGMNPFKATSCPNNTGIGTGFPCGDSFLVYPGTDGPWPGMRMEAARRGAEDAALLRLLLERDAARHDALVSEVFRSNEDYNDDPAAFDAVYERLLTLLEAKGAQA